MNKNTSAVLEAVLSAVLEAVVQPREQPMYFFSQSGVSRDLYKFCSETLRGYSVDLFDVNFLVFIVTKLCSPEQLKF